MDINLFDYYLPEGLIAQEPSAIRDECRLMVVNKEKKTYEDKIFKDIYDYLNAGDVLVRNNTKVIPARLFATKDKTGAHVEVLLLKDLGSDTWECLCGNAKAIKVGTILHFKDDELIGECLEVKDEGIRLIKFKYHGIFLEVLDRIGTMPLPPYIHKACKIMMIIKQFTLKLKEVQPLQQLDFISQMNYLKSFKRKALKLLMLL